MYFACFKEQKERVLELMLSIRSRCNSPLLDHDVSMSTTVLNLEFSGLGQNYDSYVVELITGERKRKTHESDAPLQYP